MNREEWNQFILDNNGSFLQSYEWAEFQKSIGHKVWLIEEIGFKAIVVKHNLPYFGNYLYCGRGPVIRREESFNLFLEKIRKIAKQEKSIFFKIEPNNGDLPSAFLPSNKQIQPSKTVILDLSQPEDELLQAMNQKTRYNIRLAQRKGVEIQKTKKALDIFFKLLKKTAEKDKFHLHSYQHYQNLIEILGRRDMAELFLAKYQEKIIAAVLIVFWGDKVVYLHGASDYEYRQIMAPHLLHWQAILEAKKRGFRFYDFWGIDEKKWPGLSRFKKGFGGKEIIYPGAFDLIFSRPWYEVYRVARKIL